MGQLFQPTNITPNLLGEIGQGVADVTNPVTISWQVNGNVPMTGYEIVLFKTETVSATISVTLPEPFCGRDSQGNVVMFTHTLSVLDMENVWENGQTCSYSLTLYWGNKTGSVTTLSKCVFLARSAPSVVIGGIPTPYADRKISATATYRQTDGDGILWVRWRLADTTSGQLEILDDTGRIYGTQFLAYSYDGLANQHFYSLRCDVETENGAQASTGWVNFESAYSVNDRTFPLSVSPSCDGGMNVTWGPYVNLPLNTTASTGSYSVVNGRTDIQSGGKMVWSRQDGKRMNIPVPWSVVWRGSASGDAILFSLELVGGSVVQAELTGGLLAMTLYLTLDLANPIPIASVSGVSGEFSLALTPDSLLFYSESSQKTIAIGSMNYAAWGITRVTMEGPQQNTFLKILDGDLKEDDFLSNYAEPDYDQLAETVTFGPGSRFLLEQWDSFVDPFSAGNNHNDDGPYLTGYWLYRKEPGNTNLIPVVSGSTSTIRILDYGVRNNAGPFQYYLFTEDSSEDRELGVFNTISDPVNYCNWNWILLSCTKNENGEYIVQNAYLFGNNVTSGVMSNNNKPNLMDNFTRYPMVQISRNNYRSGTLQALIGRISGCQAEYSDSAELRTEIMGLSTSTNYFFLKDRKGDLIMIRPAGEITMETGDKTPYQEQRMSFPWVEIGSADGVSVYGII